MTDWAIITGEYPPQPGGVSDYTRQIAEALIETGEEVVVFAPTCEESGAPDVPHVVRLPDHFGPRGLWRLRKELRRLRPRRILVQYTPHAFGWKAMNLPLCLLLGWRGLLGRADVRVMFHEVALPYGARPAVNALALAQRVMAKTLIAGARRVYLSTLSWSPLVAAGAANGERRLLPIPANIPTQTCDAAVAAVRRNATGGNLDAEIVGHFGTFGKAIAPLLKSSLDILLNKRHGAHVLLVGRGAERFRQEWNSDHGDRIIAAENPPGADVAKHLKACDLLIQPYPDGVTTRRSTFMAGLACGVPVVTNFGALSESMWSALRATLAASKPDAAEIASLACRLLDDPDELSRIGTAGQEVYDRRFALHHSINVLLQDD